MKSKVTYALTFLSGLLLGWLVLGWWLWPVEYVDEATYQRITAQNQASEAGLPDWFTYSVFAVLGIGLACGGLWVGYSARRTKANGPDFEWVPNPHILPAVPGEFQGLKQAINTARKIDHASLTFGPTQSTDQHFPIESQHEGEPSPGEFGVNQVDDQPAWDVWLFDKQALVTVTKVLAERADEELASRGELIEWKRPFTLETANLTMTGRAYKELEGNLRVDLTVEAKDE